MLVLLRRFMSVARSGGTSEKTSIAYFQDGKVGAEELSCQMYENMEAIVS
jgi:hypothetical protein